MKQTPWAIATVVVFGGVVVLSAWAVLVPFTNPEALGSVSGFLLVLWTIAGLIRKFSSGKNPWTF